MANPLPADDVVADPCSAVDATLAKAVGVRDPGRRVADDGGYDGCAVAVGLRDDVAVDVALLWSLAPPHRERVHRGRTARP